MICKKCGADLPDSAVFCPECGTWTVEKTPVKPTAASALDLLEEPEAPPKESRFALFWKNKKKRDLLLSILGVVAAALCLTVSIVFDNPHLNAANVASAFVKASYDQDQERLFDLLPDQLQTALESSDMKEIVLTRTLDNFWGRLEEGYQIRILSQDAVTDSSLEYILEFYQSMDLTVNQALVITVETTYSLYGEPISVENEIPVIQIENNWYYDLSASPVLENFSLAG